jgi:hypothetical protein
MGELLFGEKLAREMVARDQTPTVMAEVGRASRILASRILDLQMRWPILP